MYLAQINFVPNPILFEFAGISIRYYGFFIALGVLIGLFITNKEARKKKLNPEIAFDMVLYGAISGIIGGRILHVVSNTDYYFSNPLKIIAIWNGGLSLHGGLALGLLTLWLYLKAQKVNIAKYLDLIAPAMIFAQALGRWGNYFNQEAFGTPTKLPFGIFIEERFRPVIYKSFEYFHPTFFYEFIWNILVFITLLIVRKQKWIKDGEVALIYLIAYSFGRFWIEFLRTDSVYIYTLKLEQLLSIAIIIIAWIVMYHRRKSYNLSENRVVKKSIKQKVKPKKTK